MTRPFSLRLSSLIGLVGSLLVSVGFFVPVRNVAVTFLHRPTSYSADSFASMFANTITSGTIHNLPLEIAIGSFLLAVLIPLLASLSGTLGGGKRIIFILSLVFTTLGLLEFLTFSALLLSFSSWGGRVTETHSSGPGFWLMLIGFPLCIGSSIIAQRALSRSCIAVPGGL